MFEWNNAINKIEEKRILGLLPSVKSASPQEIAGLIENFLSEYAILNAHFDPDFDDIEDKFASSDANDLALAARYFREEGKLPTNYHCDSSWESGGYKSYDNKEAQEKHDDIVRFCNKIKG